jgi:putative flippase GtrA
VTGGSAARILRFGLVGVIAAVIHMGAFEATRRWLDLGPAPGWVLSFLLAATAAWAMNRQFTFRAPVASRSRGEWLRYLGVAAGGALAHFLVFIGAVTSLPVFSAYPALAIVPGSLASLCVTYAGASLFVFPTARKRP